MSAAASAAGCCCAAAVEADAEGVGHQERGIKLAFVFGTFSASRFYVFFFSFVTCHVVQARKKTPPTFCTTEKEEGLGHEGRACNALT
jgi:hypothetical protein